MNILITGADGFIGKNLIAFLNSREDIKLSCFTRENDNLELFDMVKVTDFIFHLAGANRPDHVGDFKKVNLDLTINLCDAISASNKKIPLIYTSSTQAVLSNPYGESKFNAEKALLAFSNESGSPVYIFRLPNIFGKWAKPNYNSVVATFCHNIVHDFPITIENPEAVIDLAYIDDVISSFVGIMDGKKSSAEIETIYKVSVGDLAEQVRFFNQSRATLRVDKVGVGFTRALYATYISYLPTQDFAYTVPKYCDERGTFVEMLKTKDSGQFSFFTAEKGVTRGGHYHHSKTEKFLVIRGNARFRFRHILTNEYHELFVHGDIPEVVETIPGWTHDITNVGDDEMIVMLWANEVFDRNAPDTYSCEI